MKPAKGKAPNVTGKDLAFFELTGIKTKAHPRKTSPRSSRLSPLLSASERGDVEAIEQLIRSGLSVNETADPSMAFYHGADGLILASRHGHLNAVKTLLRHGARLTTEAGYGSALEEALAGGHHEVVRLLLEKGARNFGFGLFGALEQGHMEVFEVVAESGIPLGGFLSRHGESLLERAIRRKKDEIAKFLLGMGVKPIDGGPLVESVARGDAELTQLLIKHGANPNQVNGLKRYPLGVACSRGHRDIIEILLKHGADLAITDVRGWSCVDWANHGGHKKLIGWLDSIGRKKRMTIPRRGK